MYCIYVLYIHTVLAYLCAYTMHTEPAYLHMYIHTYLYVGVIYYVESHQYREAYNANAPLLTMVFSPERQYLIVVTANMDLSQVAVSQKGEATEILKVHICVHAQPVVQYRSVYVCT